MWVKRIECRGISPYQLTYRMNFVAKWVKYQSSKGNGLNWVWYVKRQLLLFLLIISSMLENIWTFSNINYISFRLTLSKMALLYRLVWFQTICLTIYFFQCAQRTNVTDTFLVAALHGAESERFQRCTCN